MPERCPKLLAVFGEDFGEVRGEGMGRSPENSDPSTLVVMLTAGEYSDGRRFILEVASSPLRLSAC